MKKALCSAPFIHMEKLESHIYEQHPPTFPFHADSHRLMIGCTHTRSKALHNCLSLQARERVLLRETYFPFIIFDNFKQFSTFSYGVTYFPKYVSTTAYIHPPSSKQSAAHRIPKANAHASSDATADPLAEALAGPDTGRNRCPH